MASLTRFEIARILSARALQLSLGAPPLVKPFGDETPLSLARKELEKKVVPLSVLRRFPNNTTIRIDLE